MCASSIRLTASFGVFMSIASLGASQTAVVQRPDGSTVTTTTQSDGANTLVITGGGGGVVGGLAVSDGQLTQLPPRDPQGVPATGTSRIRGRVIAADTGRPLRRATVRLSSPGVRESRSTRTDQDGQYEFAQLPAASYTITANKSGYVSMGYKQTRPNSASRPLAVAARESRDGVDIALPPGGVITGRVVDEFGEPTTEVTVSAQRQQYINGARRPVATAAPSSANDIGEFRIYGLAPGEYYLVASPRVQVSPFDSNDDHSGYAQTYYPSAADPASAQRLTVRSGEILSNIVIALSPTRTAQVSGTVLDADGRPARGGNVMLSPRDGPGFTNSTGFVRPDGSFAINGVAPGEYVLRTLPTGPNFGASRPSAVSMATITVNGADLSNVILQPQVPVAVSGRLTGDPAALAKVQPRTTRLALVPYGNVGMMNGPLPPPQPMRDDLSFELSTYPGPVALRPISLNGLVVRSVRLNSRDVTGGFEVEPGATIDLEVEVTASVSRLAITATNTRDEAVPDRDVVVFSQDESKWGSQMPGHGSNGRTDEQGRYQSPPLLSGSYYVAAIDPPDPGQVNDPEFLESIRARAQRITLGEGETANAQIRITDR